MLRLLTPRLLLAATIVMFGAGIAALYAGYPALGSIGLFAGVLATIMAAIVITTPEALVEASYARLAAESTAADNSASASVPAPVEQGDAASPSQDVTPE